MTFHKSVMGRGILTDGAKRLSDVIDRVQKTDAELVATHEGEEQSWITSCPHCDRIIGITLKGNGK